MDGSAHRSMVHGPSSVVVFLARHGETEWNAARRFQGHSDSPLTPRGLLQGQRLARRLAGERLSAVYASDLGRSKRTAALVAAQHGLEVQTDPALREIDTGEWTAGFRDDLSEREDWQAMLAMYRHRPAEVRMPGGESVHDVMARSVAFLERVLPRHTGQRIAIIPHHVVVESLLAHALGQTANDLWLPYRGGNCHVSELAWTNGQFEVRTLYDGAHVADIGSLDGSGRAGA